MRDLKKELEDPSQIYRPDVPDYAEKTKDFRNYGEDNALFDRVKKTYLDMHTNQTVAYVKSMHEKWLNFDTCQMSIMDAILKLNDLVDESDPDVDVPNSYHAYQTAEGIRAKHPDKDWFHFVGFIHDLGKLMNFYGQQQWSTVGDTFVVGCKPAASIVYSEDTFDANPDVTDARYNTENGIYEPNCGLENVSMSWGHDEYLYQVLKHNGTTIPEEGLYMIRFHSFYPWHTGGDYKHLTSAKDESMMKWVNEFNKFDLYTKDNENLPDVDKLHAYYEGLANKYMPGLLKW